jgi:hypothetical protein
MVQARMSCSFRRLGSLFLALLVMLAGISCSSGKKEDQKPVHPVRGQVFVKDKPAVGAFVLLVPENEPAEPTDPRPRAEVDANGAFKLSTYGENDGAPAGKYIVTITWPVPEEDIEDKLFGRYADPKTSKLRATVKEGANELPAFRL